MKSFMRFLAGAALGFLVLSSGCKTITIRTILRSDDSLVRQITVAGDSTGIGDTGYPIRLHEPWSVSKVRDENDNNTYIYTISSSFSDIDELNEEIEYRGDSLQVNSSAELTKRFCWFYTFYRYEETFYAFFPFNDPPLKEYLSPEEFQLYQSGIDSSEIKDKVEAYAEENFYNAFANALIKVAANHPELSLASADIEGCKEEIIDTFDEWVFSSEDVMGALLSAGDSLLHPLRPLTDYRAEFSELDSTFSRYFALLEKIITEGYRFEVEMPGRIFDSNANKTITGNILWVTWGDVTSVAILFVLIALFHWFFRKQFIKISESKKNLPYSIKKVRVYELIFYITFGIVVVKAVPSVVFLWCLHC